MYDIRPAQASDKDAVAAFTKDTFEWGDYVADRFDRWLEDPHGIPIVAVDTDDVAVAISYASLLSPREAWFQGVRVHPDHRRRGIAGRLAEYASVWAIENGAVVARLAIEDWNKPARGQVERDGFRSVGDWVRAYRSIGDASPLPAGNGGRRVPAQEQLVKAHTAEATPAFMAWGTSPLNRAARGLFGVHWRWRRLTEDDLSQAARHDALWIARSGWVMAAPDRDRFEVGWLETREDDAHDLMRAIVDLALNQGAEALGINVPAVTWLTTAARRAGCDLHPMIVYEKPL